MESTVEIRFNDRHKTEQTGLSDTGNGNCAGAFWLETFWIFLSWRQKQNRFVDLIESEELAPQFGLNSEAR